MTCRWYPTALSEVFTLTGKGSLPDLRVAIFESFHNCPAGLIQLSSGSNASEILDLLTEMCQ